MTISKIRAYLVAGFLCLPLMVAVANENESTETPGFIVIANSSIRDSLTTEEISHLFLGRNISSKSGIKLKPVVMSGNQDLHSEFVRKILKRSPSQLRSYWSKLVFTGKGRPPISVKTVTEMKSRVSKDPSFVGYIPTTDDLDGFRVLYRSEQ